MWQCIQHQDKAFLSLFSPVLCFWRAIPRCRAQLFSSTSVLLGLTWHQDSGIQWGRLLRQWVSWIFLLVGFMVMYTFLFYLFPLVARRTELVATPLELDAIPQSWKPIVFCAPEKRSLPLHCEFLWVRHGSSEPDTDWSRMATSASSASEDDLNMSIELKVTPASQTPNKKTYKEYIFLLKGNTKSLAAN